jgi:hypothetical protein
MKVFGIERNRHELVFNFNQSNGMELNWNCTFDPGFTSAYVPTLTKAKFLDLLDGFKDNPSIKYANDMCTFKLSIKLEEHTMDGWLEWSVTDYVGSMGARGGVECSVDEFIKQARTMVG